MNNDAPKIAKQQGASPGKLVLVRHAESEWNALGKWTGRTNVHLSDSGHEQAQQLGKLLQDHTFHQAYHSEQIRTKQTLHGLLKGAGQEVPHQESHHLNERDYGDYTGLNKWEVQDQLGTGVFNQIRRSWDYPIPNGENLEMVYGRAVPFYLDTIVPQLLQGKNVLVVSHGNTIRALMKYLENISHEGIKDVEMPLGHALIYHVTPQGRAHSKEQRNIEIKATKA
ncbi:MAG TPA: 2,3-bisphosphoglycerate-dependent phosphoglycerate mutase [Nevskiaceae bacterium]|nr:2,3-bisphosphoglycerate-dependent phosphoglycerate mutase [Nevskiaceae bacterium]